MAKVTLTTKRIDDFKCPPEKAQAFLWHTQNGLGVRATPNGKPAFVFQSMYGGKTIRITIGNVDTWTIPNAQMRARELQILIDQGIDPREAKAKQLATDEASRSERAKQEQTVGEAWDRYLSTRQAAWGERHYSDHVKLSKPAGTTSKRRGAESVTLQAGPLAVFMPLTFKELTSDRIEAWAAIEGAKRPAVARLSWRVLAVFLNWCAEHKDYKGLLPDTNPAKTKETRKALGKASPKQDVLQRGQLEAWFSAVQQISSPAASAYLQALLLTGARAGELVGLRWEDINERWRGITIRDKVEGTREIPLTPYVRKIIMELPRINEFVFASHTSASGHVYNANKPHASACTVAGLDGLTIHGLRRSFASLTEWLDLPAGAIAQIMGHKPSATAEKHYKVRPLELLRQHHEHVEAWVLEQAKIAFDPTAEVGRLRAVA